MKKGDELLCIRKVKNYYRGIDDVTSHIKGKKYKVAIDSRIVNDAEYVYIESELETTSNGYLGFLVHGNPSNFKGWNKLSTHFINNQEDRKRKLNKLSKK